MLPDETKSLDTPEASGSQIRQRDRLPDRYSDGADFVIERAEDLDPLIARMLAIVQTGMELNKIDPVFGAKLIVNLTQTFIGVTRIHTVMKLLRESGMEVQIREVERIEGVDSETDKFMKLLTGEIKTETANGVKSK